MKEERNELADRSKDGILSEKKRIWEDRFGNDNKQVMCGGSQVHWLDLDGTSIAMDNLWWIRLLIWCDSKNVP